ncbi:nitrate/nitrite transporter NrtS [Aestuariirhabdus sp. LZHN29]|uniref:nitrate/nitrite transporter NrtS n=1 Tax=Aestuariirhabdus sp. LZHN29 TaxID=3417462 RepID=UPI003CF62AD6
MSMDDSWLYCATRTPVVKRALRVAIIVGTLLVLINYADRIMEVELTQLDAIKMLLTYLVPYCVSTWSAVATLRHHKPSAGRH